MKDRKIAQTCTVNEQRHGPSFRQGTGRQQSSRSPWTSSSLVDRARRHMEVGAAGQDSWKTQMSEGQLGTRDRTKHDLTYNEGDLGIHIQSRSPNCKLSGPVTRGLCSLTSKGGVPCSQPIRTGRLPPNQATSTSTSSQRAVLERRWEVAWSRGRGARKDKTRGMAGSRDEMGRRGEITVQKARRGGIMR
jgi:hypothetical protein